MIKPRRKAEVPDHTELLEKAPGLVSQVGDPGADPDAALIDLKPNAGGKGGNEDIGETVSDKPYLYVEQMPQLPGGGGTAAIVAAIQKAARYPAPALGNQIEGRIFVSFVVNSLGEVSDVKVIKGLGYGLDEETIRAVKSLPRFIPGKQNGRAVSVCLHPFRLALRFNKQTPASLPANPQTGPSGLVWGFLLAQRARCGPGPTAQY